MWDSLWDWTWFCFYCKRKWATVIFSCSVTCYLDHYERCVLRCSVPPQGPGTNENRWWRCDKISQWTRQGQEENFFSGLGYGSIFPVHFLHMCPFHKIIQHSKSWTNQTNTNLSKWKFNCYLNTCYWTYPEWFIRASCFLKRTYYVFWFFLQF